MSGLVIGSAGGMLFPAGTVWASPVVRSEQAALVGLASSAGEALWAGPGSQRAVRRQVAEAVAAAAGVDPAPVVAAWDVATDTEVAVGLAALRQVGVRYRARGTAPDEGFDCSGFTSWAWRQVGVELPRTSYDQLRGDWHPIEEARVGDLVGYPGHVMLYLGGGTYVHSPTSGRTVEVRAFGRYVNRFYTPAVDSMDARNASVMTRVRAF